MSPQGTGSTHGAGVHGGSPGLPSPGCLPPPPAHLSPCLPERARRRPLLALTTETRARQPWKASWKRGRVWEERVQGKGVTARGAGSGKKIVGRTAHSGWSHAP